MNKIFLQGICYDQKSSFQQGPAEAPPLIRERFHSDAYNSFAENGVDMKELNIEDKGDFKIESYFDIEKLTLQHLQEGGKVFTLGGDHSITYPILKAYHQFFPAIHILHIDAHGDLYHEFEGDHYSHACPFARIMESQLAVELVQIGIRTLTTHQRKQIQQFGVKTYEMKDFDVRKLPELTAPVYVSLDMDALDPAYAPGVSHQEAGGFSTRELINLIHQIKVPIIGADVVEYNPRFDQGGITAAAAAKLMKELLAKM